jgi:hypothetical protein
MFPGHLKNPLRLNYRVAPPALEAWCFSGAWSLWIWMFLSPPVRRPENSQSSLVPPNPT